MRRMLGVALVLALGCGDDKNNTTTDGSTDASSGSSGSTGTATTTMTPTGGTTGDSGTMGGTQSTGTTDTSPPTTGTASGSTTATDTTTSGSTTAVDTSTGTTGGGGSVEEECTALCDAVIDCQLAPPDPAMCVDGCLGDFDGAMGECLTALESFLTCLSTVTCDQLVAFFQNDDPGPCADAFMAAEVACGGGMPGDCTVGVSSNPQGTECSLQKGCQGQPPLEMQCDANQCVCLVDGVEMGMCPADAICKTEDLLEQKAADCCGF